MDIQQAHAETAVAVRENSASVCRAIMSSSSVPIT
jgi:hypothetical protein